MCRALSAEEVEQQLAWRSGDAGSRFPPPCSNGLSGPRPLKLKTCAAQSPREEPGRATDVAPKGLIHCMLVRSRPTTVGSSYVLVVDEELIEVREPAHPSDAEEAWRRSRSDRRNEPSEVPQRERSSSSFGQAAPRTGQDKPGASEVAALAQDEVCGEIAGRPRREESRCLGTEFVEQAAELCSLDGVEERIGHIAGAHRVTGGRSCGLLPGWRGGSRRARSRSRRRQRGRRASRADRPQTQNPSAPSTP
jgi:hypothetical protein